MKRLTASLAALAVAASTLVAAPAPARAGEDDLIKFILGAAAIGLILNETQKNRPAARAQQAPPHHAVPRHAAPHRQRQAKVIPASCLFDVQGRYGPRPVVGQRCVKRWDQRARLPGACSFDLRPGPRERTVYGLRCLRREGYRIVRG